VFAFDHRFALEPGTRPSAPDKKSFSSASCPILACSSLMSTAAGSPERGAEPEKTSLA
jgi:hypothetical protein